MKETQEQVQMVHSNSMIKYEDSEEASTIFVCVFVLFSELLSLNSLKRVLFRKFSHFDPFKD